MKTPIQAFRNFIQNDRMQTTYTKLQIIDLIDLILIEREKEHLIDAYINGVDEGYSLGKNDDFIEGYSNKNGEEYYNDKYTNNEL